MNLTSKRRVAALLLKVGENRVSMDSTKLQEVKDAITRGDIRSLINKGVISAKRATSQSHVRSREIKVQKRKGRRAGKGSRKGVATSRQQPKSQWMDRVRLQRQFLSELKEKNLIINDTYRTLRNKIKGGYFRSRRHIKLYLDEQKLWSNNGK
jgi:large subunit ribosomal protein L19e